VILSHTINHINIDSPLKEDYTKTWGQSRLGFLHLWYGLSALSTFSIACHQNASALCQMKE
jgi:hypothetical protein